MNKTKAVKKLTAADMRVAIAKDVIAQIRAEKLLICHNFYWGIKDKGYDYNGESSQIELQENPKCTACAVGAAVLSGVRLFNKISIANNNSCDPEETKYVLKRWFSKSQMALIEDAFEGPRSAGACLFSNESPNQKAIKFGERFEDGEKRAVAIFKNMSENRGTFKP